VLAKTNNKGIYATKHSHGKFTGTSEKTTITPEAIHKRTLISFLFITPPSSLSFILKDFHLKGLLGQEKYCIIKLVKLLVY
jgi:hypothetical protein